MSCYWGFLERFFSRIK